MRGWQIDNYRRGRIYNGLVHYVFICAIILVLRFLLKEAVICQYSKRNISDVYLLYPMFRYEENEPHFPVGKSQGASGDINIHFVRLPFIFEDDEEKVKEQLRDVIKRIFSL